MHETRPSELFWEDRKLPFSLRRWANDIEEESQREPGVAVPPSPTTDTDLDTLVLPKLISAPDLARKLQLPLPRVDSALRRYREIHPDCAVEVENRRPNEPRYLYRTGDVQPVVQKLVREQ